MKKGDIDIFSARVFINNGAVLISVPKVIADSRDLKERIILIENEWSRKHKKKGKCFGKITLELEEGIK